jgi:hypothetical protein
VISQKNRFVQVTVVYGITEVEAVIPKAAADTITTISMMMTIEVAAAA